MNNRRFSIFAAAVLALSIGMPRSASADETGRAGFTLYGGAAVPIGGKRAREDTRNGSLVGFLARYGLTRHWDGGFSVEHHNVNPIEVTPILFSGIFTMMPDAKWSPIARLGFGAAQVQGFGHPGDKDIRPAIQAGLGLEGRICSHFMVGLYTDLLTALQSDASDVQYSALTGGIHLTYLFGPYKKK